MTAKRLSPLTCLALCLSLTSTANGAELQVRRLPAEVARKAGLMKPEYIVFAPKPESARTRLPLLIFLHGAGGTKGDIERVRRIATPAFKGMRKFSGTTSLFVAPHCAREKNGKRGGWLPEDLDLLLKHLKATLPVDASRIYLTGNSMGGYGCWVWAANSPEHFAAVAPIVGGLGNRGPKSISPELDRWAKNLARIPVWAFHGAKDRVVPADRSQRMIDLIKAKGGKQAKLTIFPDERHGASRKVYTSAEFYKWMFGQRSSRTGAQ